jgi:hypothetical protein
MGSTGIGTRFTLATLALWRVTHLLAEEDGPADAVVRLRHRVGSGQLGELMDCFYCLSVWLAVPAAPVVARRRRDVPLVWLALSGAACLLERATSERLAVPEPPTQADETRGARHELLWQEAEGI